MPNIRIRIRVYKKKKLYCSIIGMQRLHAKLANGVLLKFYCKFLPLNCS